MNMEIFLEVFWVVFLVLTFLGILKSTVNYFWGDLNSKIVEKILTIKD